MTFKRWILLWLLATIISLLAACGGPNTFNPQNQAPPAQTNVTISVSTTLPTPPNALSLIPQNPPPTLSVSVSNDPDTATGGAGVNWLIASCQNSSSGFTGCNTNTCSGNTCGYLYLQSDQTKTPITYSSDQATLVYQPPSTFPVPGNNLYIEILAIAVADQTKNALTPAQITGFASIIPAGTYVFQAAGSSNGSPYQVAGAITLDGNGNVTAGHETLNMDGESEQEDSTQVNPDVTQPSCTQNPAPASCYYFYGSGYFVGPDGRGSLILGNMDQAGTLANETFSLEVLSSSNVLIAELDTNSSSGTLVLQNSTAASTLPTGAYALVTVGVDPSANAIGIGGVLNIDNIPTAGSISGSGSIATQDYYSVGDSDCSAPHGLTGSSVAPVTGVAVAGIVTFNLVTTNCAPNSFGPTQLTGYIVDATHVQLIESDASYFTAGPAIAQSSAPGSFTAASFSGPYVFGIDGIAPVSGIPASFTSATVICPDGSGDLDSCTNSSGSASGGYTDTYLIADNAGLPAISCTELSSCPGAVSAELSGDYHVDSRGIGRVNLTGLKYTPQPTPTTPIHPDIYFFLTGPLGAPALVLYAGALDNWYPALGIGIAYPQQTPADALSFGSPENYGVSFTEQIPGGPENDGSGWMTANPSSTTPLPACFVAQGITAPSLLQGCVDDFNNIGIGFGSPIALGNTFTPPSDNFGRTGGNFLTVPGTSPVLPAEGEYYFITPDQGFFVETDLVSNAVNGFPTQVTMSSFAKACDVTGQNPNLPCSSSAAASSRKGSAKRLSAHTLPGK